MNNSANSQIERGFLDTFPDLNEEPDDIKPSIHAFSTQQAYFNNSAFDVEMPAVSKKNYR